MAVVRSASLRGFVDLVHSLGGDPETVARRAGVPREALYAEDVYISVVAEAELMQLASETLECHDFGLRLSDYQDISGLGPLALALRHQPTLGDALGCANRFLYVHSPGSSLVLEPDDDPHMASLRYAWTADTPRFVQSHENALLNLHRVILLLAGGNYGLRTVDLGHRPASPTSRYEALFEGARLRGGQPVTRLRMPHSALLVPVADADESLRRVATFYLARQTAPDGRETSARTHAVVEAMLGAGRVGMNEVCRQLELPPRTLQRRLAREGVTLSDVVDSIRRRRAERMLTEGVPMVDVAAGIDLDQATFSRYARRWWGHTASAHRRQLLLASRPAD